jgi:hypothetical protein
MYDHVRRASVRLCTIPPDIEKALADKRHCARGYVHKTHRHLHELREQWKKAPCREIKMLQLARCDGRGQDQPQLRKSTVLRDASGSMVEQEGNKGNT